MTLSDTIVDFLLGLRFISRFLSVGAGASACLHLSLCVCVCVCVCARARVCVCVCARVCMREFVSVLSLIHI